VSSPPMTKPPRRAGPAGRRWLARAAWAALAAAIIVALAAEGVTGLTLTVVGLGGAVRPLPAGTGSSPSAVRGGG